MTELDTAALTPPDDVGADGDMADSAPAAPPRPSTADRDARRAVSHNQHLQRVQHRLGRIRASAASRQSRSAMCEGDVVIVYSSPVLMSPIRLQRGAIHSNRYGHFHHDDFIGRPSGSRISARQRGGFVYALPVSPQLWTLSLTHRTQILYAADIALTLTQLNVQPGHVVLESGTGSGSLTVALAHAVRPHGHVHTFEFNSERVDKARHDFDSLQLAPDLVTVHHRDVCAHGFPTVPPFVDSIFLDLPSPWCVIESCKAALRHGGRLASFSPCIEQVQRTVRRMEECAFADIRTMECLQREYDVGEQKMERIADTKAAASQQSSGGRETRLADGGKKANGSTGLQERGNSLDEQERTGPDGQADGDSRSSKKAKEEDADWQRGQRTMSRWRGQQEEKTKEVVADMSAANTA